MSEILKQEQGNGISAAERTRDGMTFRPQFDIVETEDELLLFGDLAGVTAENLDIRFENRELTVYGRVERRYQDIDRLTREFEIGDFHRAFRVGEEIDADKIAAEINQGVLTIHLPKSEAVKPRRIKVREGCTTAQDRSRSCQALASGACGCDVPDRANC